VDLPCRTIILKIIVLCRKGGGAGVESEVNIKKNIFSENVSSEARCVLLSFRKVGGTLPRFL